MNGWQDIYTAPKDGSEFLALTPRGVRIASWAKDQYASKPRPYFRLASFGCPRSSEDRANQPTRWQPLPDLKP